MRHHAVTGQAILSLLAFAAVILTVGGCGTTEIGPMPSAAPAGAMDATLSNSQRMVHEGRRTFRFDTFGSEAFWGDAIKLHEAIAGGKQGGVGGGVSPKTALAVGLKMDSESLPASLVDQIKKGTVDFDAPATTPARACRDRRGFIPGRSLPPPAPIARHRSRACGVTQKGGF